MTLSSPDNHTRHSVIMFGLLAIAGILLFYLSTFRQIGNYGVETDFYARFVPNAQRLLSGIPLKIEWQPPLYPAILAVVYSIVHDWFRTGLLVSVFSGVLVLGSTYRLFRDVSGNGAAVAAVMALTAWPEFLQFSLTASTDMLFLSLMMLSLAVAVGGDRLTIRQAFMAGFIAALASLTRTNGIALITIALLCGSRMEAGQRLRLFLFCLAGFALPWALWATLAGVSGSPVFPTRTYQDMAIHFFHPEGLRSNNSDTWQWVDGRFSSLADVLFHDPRVIVSSFARGLISNWWNLFDNRTVRLLPLAWILVPFAGISVLGIAYLALIALRKRDGLRIAFWIVIIAQYAILCLRPFGPRYYLFLVPVAGYGAYAAGSLLFSHIRISEKARMAIIGIVISAVMILAGSSHKINLARHFNNDDMREITAASSALRRMSKPGDRLISRKPHLAFQTGLVDVLFPLVETTGDLYRAVCPIPSTTRTFLFFGKIEANLRPALRFLRTPENAPEWLIPIGSGEPVGASWALYRVRCQ